jgi:hypothetical protein
MKRKVLWIAIGIIVLVVFASSGWVYNTIKANEQLELANLRGTFVQQYGNQAVISKIVSPSKVYAALWIDSDNTTYVSWNIGGLWITVYDYPGKE